MWRVDLVRGQNTFSLSYIITWDYNWCKLLSDSLAKSSLKFMNFLLESIITYRLPLPFSKISMSLGFGDVFRCDGSGLDSGGGGGDDGGGGGADNDSCCVCIIMFFVLVFESLLFPVFFLALACICKEVSPLNPVSSILMELLMVSNSPDIQFLVSFI